MYGGTLRIAAPSPGANIGWPASLTGGGTVAQAYYETLLRSDQNGNLYGWLAQSYKIADDKKSITFTIRKGVKFTDGSDLTADVVKWNLDQYKQTQPKWASVQVVDPNTVRVNFTSWDNSLPAAFGDSQPSFFMVSEAAYDKVGKVGLTSQPVGTGPFTVASFVMDSSMKLVKNPNYWGTDPKTHQKLPYLDEVDYTFTADAASTLMMAKTGEVDMVLHTLTGQQLTDYKNLGWRVNFTSNSNDVLVPDSNHPDSPWSKLEVREAAEYAIDRVTIAKMFGSGWLKAPTQIPPESTSAYQTNYPLARNYDPAKAKQLLTQAGYPNGFKSTLIVWQGGNHDIAALEQSYLSKVGIQVDVQFPDTGKFSTIVGPMGHYQNALLEAPSTAQGATGLGCVTGAQFLFGKNILWPADLTQALNAATSTVTPDVKLVQAATDIMTKNALMIPVYEIGTDRVEKTNVHVDWGHRGDPAALALETAYLSK
jgi:ABC-type transport system substrate-binding protein